MWYKKRIKGWGSRVKTYNINEIDVNQVDKSLFDFSNMKKVSLFTFCLAKTGGACDFECDKVPEENRDWTEGGDGFVPFPEEHSKFCVRACPRFEIFDSDKASKILELLRRRETYHFNFTVETPQPISEKNQEDISYVLKKQLNLQLLNKGYFTTVIDIDNEFYLEENKFIPPKKDD